MDVGLLVVKEKAVSPGNVTNRMPCGNLVRPRYFCSKDFIPLGSSFSLLFVTVGNCLVRLACNTDPSGQVRSRAGKSEL